MNFHVSIDDVIYSLMDLAKEKPQSVFDNVFFNMLERFNQKYGAVFSLYAFENYAETFFINDVPAAYWEELISAGFIKIGFHGTFFESDNETFRKKAENFYKVIPEKLWASTVRLHRYAATSEQILCLKKYGMLEMLCREEESCKRQSFPNSYILTKEEEWCLREGCIKRNEMTFRITDICLEFYDEFEIRQKIKEASRANKSVFTIFTHEREVLENPHLLETALSSIVEIKDKYSFIF